MRLIPLLAALAAAPGGGPVIVALGDSTTAGTPYYQSPVESPPDGRGKADAPYPYWLGRAFPGWKVLNRGVNGERTDEIRRRFERDALEPRPRYVVILAGVNDIFQGTPDAEIRSNLLWMYRRARTAGAVPVAATVLPFDRATPGQSRRISELNAWIIANAREMGIPLCDLNKAAADGRRPRRLAGSPDGLHPDLAGYRRMGEEAGRVLAGLEDGRLNRAR